MTADRSSMTPDESLHAAGFRDNYFARMQALVQREEFSRWIIFGSNDRKYRQVAMADGFENFVAGPNFTGPDFMAIQGCESGNEQQSCDNDENFRTHGSSSSISRDSHFWQHRPEVGHPISFAAGEWTSASGARLPLSTPWKERRRVPALRGKCRREWVASFHFSQRRRDVGTPVLSGGTPVGGCSMSCRIES